MDYRKLNTCTVRDQYPLPLIDDIFDQVAGSAIYSTLDLRAGYHQIKMAEVDIPKTAFRCHLGLFEYLRMPFGLANAPAVFQRTMDKVLAGLIGRCVFVYLDDIVVYSSSPEAHAQHLQAVFDRLRHAGLKLKPSKCHFGLPQVRLLGHIISAKGKSPDPEKTAAISTLPSPTTVREVRSFLGSCSYYRNNIANYAKIAEPLTELTRKHVRMEWNPTRQAAFDQLKRELVSNRIMAPPRSECPYKLYTDACDYAVGAILVQEDEHGVERVISYVSHALSAPQKHWATIEKEAYAVVYAIEKLRTYLYGAQFTVYTDHKPLKALFTQQMNSTKVQRWGVLLAEYGARIEYRSGRNNIRADMLSRIRPHPEVAVFDTGDWVETRATVESEPEIRELLPLLHDGLDLRAVAIQQQEEFPDLWHWGEDHDNENYDIIGGALYSSPVARDHEPGYPRLVLPQPYREAVINKAHREVSHMATWNTLRRQNGAYTRPK